MFPVSHLITKCIDMVGYGTNGGEDLEYGTHNYEDLGDLT